MRRVEIADLVRSGRIACAWHPMLEAPAWDGGLRPAVDRWRGMFLGLAIGDALGNTSEAINPAEREEMFGKVTGYRRRLRPDGPTVGLPSDDTQLCAWAMEQILRDGRFVPEAYLDLLASRRIYGIGSTVRDALRAWKARRDWLAAAQPSAGNGALMRCPAAFVPHLGAAGAGLGLDAALMAAVTHNDPAALSSAVAFTLMLAELLVMDTPPAASWWVERYVELAAPLEGPSRYEGRAAPAARGYHGPLWRFVREQVPAALAGRSTAREACDHWHSGAYLLETVPSVLFILARHAGDPVQAILRAVNDTRDNDTIAAVVGAAVGALHGERALPRAWRGGLLGRTRDDDDGAFFDLLEATERHAGNCFGRIGGYQAQTPPARS